MHVAESKWILLSGGERQEGRYRAHFAKSCVIVKVRCDSPPPPIASISLSPSVSVLQSNTLIDAAKVLGRHGKGGRSQGERPLFRFTRGDPPPMYRRKALVHLSLSGWSSFAPRLQQALQSSSLITKHVESSWEL